MNEKRVPLIGSKESTDAFRPVLGVWDAAAIIVGVIIGAGIFRTPDYVMLLVKDALSWPSSEWIVVSLYLALWVLGGLICLCGAFSLAELSSAFPTTGGNYYFLGQCYGPAFGFVFAWTQLLVIRPGSIAGMAVVFGEYIAGNPFITEHSSYAWRLELSIGAIILLTLLNIAGVNRASNLQNCATLFKCLVIVLMFLLAVAAFFGLLPTTEPHDRVDFEDVTLPHPLLILGSALVSVLWTYGGWDESPYIASEVRNPERNVPRSIILGICATILLYLLANIAYLLVLTPEVLPFVGVHVADAFAECILEDRWAAVAGIAVAISALGAVNGMILTGGRLYYAAGVDHGIARWLGKVHPRTRTPINALVVQAIITIATLVYLQAGFTDLIYYTGFAFWLFMALLGGAVFIRRWKYADINPPVKAWGYPVTPALFVIASLAIAVSLLISEFDLSMVGIGIMIAGVIVYRFQ